VAAAIFADVIVSSEILALVIAPLLMASVGIFDQAVPVVEPQPSVEGDEGL
jgi:hypothetical protein